MRDFRLSRPGRRLDRDLRANSENKTINAKDGHRITYDEFIAGQSKSIIDEIDSVLAKHYGFTDKELDFIIICSVSCPGGVVIKTYDAVRELRDAGVFVAGGFHSPVERGCLDFLLRGAQPVVLCPACGTDWLSLDPGQQGAVAPHRVGNEACWSARAPAPRASCHLHRPSRGAPSRIMTDGAWLMAYR